MTWSASMSWEEKIALAELGARVAELETPPKRRNPDVKPRVTPSTMTEDQWIILRLRAQLAVANDRIMDLKALIGALESNPR